MSLILENWIYFYREKCWRIAQYQVVFSLCVKTIVFVRNHSRNVWCNVNHIYSGHALYTIQALSLASHRHGTEIKEANIWNKRNKDKKPNCGRRQTSWLSTKRDRGFELEKQIPLEAGWRPWTRDLLITTPAPLTTRPRCLLLLPLPFQVYFHAYQTNFHMKGFTQTRFETEAQDNSKMALILESLP